MKKLRADWLWGMLSVEHVLYSHLVWNVNITIYQTVILPLVSYCRGTWSLLTLRQKSANYGPWVGSGHWELSTSPAELLWKFARNDVFNLYQHFLKLKWIILAATTNSTICRTDVNNSDTYYTNLTFHLIKKCLQIIDLICFRTGKTFTTPLIWLSGYKVCPPLP
jgi:hypothetical protein